ncbi:uncharacterized protein LOC18422013 [Amborella trichopoda]|uniref:uncharacterized protein LOC18422013 n=1 Tax=Amborella trichopoda TaxID=13333 RepID=UPI0005D44B06|nr:uncharacterized protein LOC18422013 [Amborella trichopoda]|eukprot:XP_006827295.2 uncharacterized protein LOC18422013 [Amborella trichopoda]
MGPNEPYWQNNSSFSPPLSRRWDYRFQSEGLPYGSHGGIQLYGSSLSSNSKESRSRVSSERFPNPQYSASDGMVSYISSPSDSFQTQLGTPPVQGVNLEEFVSSAIGGPSAEPAPFSPSTEGFTSTVPYSVGSTSSQSDAGDGEATFKTHTYTPSSNRNFSTRYSFMSKPVYPLSLPNQLSLSSQTPEFESLNTSTTRLTPIDNNNYMPLDLKYLRSLTELSGFQEIDFSSQRDQGLRWSSASSLDFTEIALHLDPEHTGTSNSLSGSLKCALCERLLSQRSPWSSRRIVRSGDMPVAGVLSCCHVYHAECLEQTTPKTQKSDPPCPLCMKANSDEAGAVSEQPVVFSKVMKYGFPKLKDDTGAASSSRGWGACGQFGDCVEVPPRNSMSLLSRSRLKKHLSLKGSSGKGLPDSSKDLVDPSRLRKIGSCSSQVPSARKWQSGCR